MRGAEPAMLRLAGVDQAVALARVSCPKPVALVHVDQAAARPGAMPPIASGERLGAELALRASIDSPVLPA